MTTHQAIHQGSCLCGAVTFELLGTPRAATHCHCRMCQKQHGAAFATYISVKRADLRYLAGEEALLTYHSSAGVQRRFCGRCGSNIEWSGSSAYPDWLSIPLAALDTPFIPAHLKQVHLDSRVAWLDAPAT